MPKRPNSVERKVLEFLVCPVSKGPLVYDAERHELISQTAHLAFPIQNGIPILLYEDARKLEE